MSKDPIVLLYDGHRDVRTLLREIQAPRSPLAPSAIKRAVDAVVS